MVLKIVPGLPVEKRTVETWSASNSPATNRQVVTIAGGPRLEIGTRPGYGKVLGPEEVNYLYDRATDTVYRTGVFLDPSVSASTPVQMFKRLLASPGVRLAGSRTYRGRMVYVLQIRSREITGMIYVDKRTYEPMMSDERGTDLHMIVRTLAYKSLPATTANLALTRLPAAHRTAHLVLRASPHIKALYGEAAFPSGDYAAG